MKSSLIISFFVYLCVIPNILAQNNNDTTKSESQIKRLFKIDNTFCWVEIEGNKGKVYYEKGVGYTEIIFIEKTDEGKLIWKEFYKGEHTGTIVFYDENYKTGTFTRHKDDKIFTIREYENKK